MKNTARLSLALATGLILSNFAAAQQNLAAHNKPSPDVFREGDVSSDVERYAAPTAEAASSTSSVSAEHESIASAPSPELKTRPNASEVALPVGTAIRMKLSSGLSTRTAKEGDRFSGSVSENVQVDGRTIVPAGAPLEGRILAASNPRRLMGRPSIDLLPEAVVLTDGRKLPIIATVVDTSNPDHFKVNEEGRIKGPGHTSGDKVEVAAGTGVGAITGMIIAGGKGSLIGAGAGAALAAGHWLWKRHQLDLPEGTEIIFEISAPVAQSSATRQGE